MITLRAGLFITPLEIDHPAAALADCTILALGLTYPLILHSNIQVFGWSVLNSYESRWLFW